jgi:hypothetical protein
MESVSVLVSYSSSPPGFSTEQLAATKTSGAQKEATARKVFMRRTIATHVPCELSEGSSRWASLAG